MKILKKIFFYLLVIFTFFINSNLWSVEKKESSIMNNKQEVLDNLLNELKKSMTDNPEVIIEYLNRLEYDKRIIIEIMLEDLNVNYSLKSIKPVKKLHKIPKDNITCKNISLQLNSYINNLEYILYKNKDKINKIKSISCWEFFISKDPQSNPEYHQLYEEIFIQVDNGQKILDFLTNKSLESYKAIALISTEIIGKLLLRLYQIHIKFLMDNINNFCNLFLAIMKVFMNARQDRFLEILNIYENIMDLNRIRLRQTQIKENLKILQENKKRLLNNKNIINMEDYKIQEEEIDEEIFSLQLNLILLNPMIESFKNNYYQLLIKFFQG